MGKSSKIKATKDNKPSAPKQKKGRKKGGGWLSTALLLMVFLVGLSILLYPTVSNWWNSKSASRVIADYNSIIENSSEEDFIKWRSDARDYNLSLIKDNGRFNMTDAERKVYETLLNVGGTGTIGSIEIPTLSVYLPIYHGTGEAVLASGVGHLEGSSLPVGGAGTHCVLTGHRGLPSAKLFTDLDRIEVGDLFLLHVLNETLAYEVDQIVTVLPGELDELAIDPEEDYCTLITCTPYGVNSHRLLIRGHRVSYEEKANTILKVSPNAIKIDPLLVAPIVAAPILLVLLVWLLISTSKRRKRKSVNVDSFINSEDDGEDNPPAQQEGGDKDEKT